MMSNFNDDIDGNSGLLYSMSQNQVRYMKLIIPLLDPMHNRNITSKNFLQNLKLECIKCLSQI